MKSWQLMAGASLALCSVWAIAQEAPESLLPPGFDQPQPAPRPTSAPKAPAKSAPAPAAPARAPGPSTPVVSAPASPAPAGEVRGVVVAPAASASGTVPGEAGAAPPVRKYTLEELERLSPEDFEVALGLKPTVDMPAAARRSMKEIGVLAVDEGGLAPTSLSGQPAQLVRAALAGTKQPLVSRWGHILLRRALASRLDAPQGMNPADFAALRAGVLVRIGEGEAARAVVQDVDTGNFTPDLTQAALDAYVATADFTGMCPITTLQGRERDDAQWQAARAICQAFRGEGAQALRELDRQLDRKTMPRVDLLLAQKYAGAAGKARRAVTIEWDEVKDMTPWRYALAIAVGLQPPDALMRNAGPRFDYMTATAPMVGLAQRAASADRAGAAGVLSSAAMIDLYGQLYAYEDANSDWGKRAANLRDAYIAAAPQARLEAMQALWNGAAEPGQRYSRQVLTAYAAARLPANANFADNAHDIIASMLAAGLDANAQRWSGAVSAGSEAWALLMLASPTAGPVDAGSIDDFNGDDASEDSRKAKFLLAGLAGLDRLEPGEVKNRAEALSIDLARQTKWTRAIDRAAEVRNPALVAMLAGLGMQGDNWGKMTPLYLYHIVSALHRVGLGAEARMIAAEAVARG